ncbi:MAG TPA: ferrous iron transport protein B [Mediterranea massiliensis]|uniref:Ferrous iron transport protein B n=1 Tax=Mediterranea massiliensis TaxID=1841865 RepID=A0A921I080_9BACT|nr:ferrous iron transport protein B [Mediterranea massiliensis]MBM6735723.1 ferrous iron transport protein B [Mediterranea massiliensis]CCZ48751.1 ferrous iron transport protein B [Bacteroides sp. CAG:661]HJF92872.1 ferrous iron transport protein B [Mediterranea massiliensis]
MRLSELKTGEKGVIVKVMGHGGFRKRIVEMGFIKGKTVEVLLNAPLKDPVKYKVMGYEISLRRQEADMIEVISEQEAREHNVQPGYHKGLEEDIRLTEEEMRNLARDKRRTINVALVGNPNCGKTSLFNIASGAHEHVGNYSGVTVDAKEGFFDFQGYHFRIVDLPGTYSLSAYSPEEIYVRRHIIDQTPDIIINVVDASNLERNLYLTTQLIDMNVRMVVALNMYDELEASGNTLDYVKLGELFGVPMLPTVSRTGRGVEKLFHILITLYEGGDFLDKKGQVRAEILEDFREWHKEYVPDHAFGSHQEEEEHPRGFFRHIHINHGPELERSIDAVKLVISENENIRHKYSTRFLAIKLLENDKDLEGMVKGLPNGDKILEVRDREKQRIREVLNEDSEQAITDAKYGFISGALRETFVDNHQDKEHMTRVIDSIVTHRIWGFPVFFLFMFLMFEITFVLGAYPQGWIESLVAVIGDFISNNMSEGPLKDLLIDGIIGGVGGVIVFLPNILILYLFISLMEDSGYMARAAFIMDKIMHKMGLHGKSFIPLIMGFGCNVPAVMASRTIENRKSRLVTILINPLMSCSARLPIYLLLVGVFFPQHASLVLLSIYSLGIILAVIMARLFSRFLVKGDDTPFVMELPPYRMPTSKAIFRHTWEKGAQYLRKMGGIIMVASIVIWALGYYPRPDASADLAQQQENSYIGRIGKAIEPVMEPLGFDWKLSIGILSGVGAKELVVSSLGVLYADDAEADQTTLAERLPITPLVAYGYMVFVLLYFPCIATLAAIRQEAGSWKWAAFAATYTTVLAWIMSFAVHQLGGLFV